MAVREIVRRLFRLRPKGHLEAKARLIALVQRGLDGLPVTQGLADIAVVVERYRISPDEVRWFEKAIEAEAARAAGEDS